MALDIETLVSMHEPLPIIENEKNVEDILSMPQQKDMDDLFFPQKKENKGIFACFAWCF